jgi:hypothetical protein
MAARPALSPPPLPVVVRLFTPRALMTRHVRMDLHANAALRWLCRPGVPARLGPVAVSV